MSPASADRSACGSGGSIRAERDGYRGVVYGPAAFVVWIGFVIEGLFKQRAATTAVWLCRRHRFTRWVTFAAWIAFPPAMALVFWLGLVIKSPGMATLAVAGFTGWLVALSSWRPRLLRVVGMENGYYIVTGPGEPFRRSLSGS
jgi:hypothetical protein